MRKVPVSQLRGGEILGKDLYTSTNYTILMAKGTILKKEYIDKLPLLGVEAVYLNDEKIWKEEDSSGDTFSVVSQDIQEECNKKVKDLLETHIYRHNRELETMCSVAEKLIENIMKEDEIRGKVVEVKEECGDLYSHSVNVCGLATLLALKMEMPQKEVVEIAKGSILHDIGLRYITTPYENIEVKSLNIREQGEYRKHVMQGYQALNRESWLSQTAKDIILFHHEAEDGSGYPMHLRGDKLSLAVKIAIICEAFDEMMSGIGHEQTKVQETVEYMKYHKGKKFDAVVTDIFLKMIIQFPTGCLVQTSEGETGKVIRQNRGVTDRPVVLVTCDRNGLLLETPKEVDLCKALNVFITRVLG